MSVTAIDHELLTWDDTKTRMQVKLGELIQYFQVGIPINGDGTPNAYIDPTILLPTLIELGQDVKPDDIEDLRIKEAMVPIEYDEGLPTVMGIPLWERFDGEPIPYYKMFKEYRELKYTTGSRSIAKLIENSGMTGRQLNALARVYHWQMRVKAFDRYKEFEKALQRKQAIEKLTSSHAKHAETMLVKAMDYIEKHPEQLTPKTAIQLAELAMKAGRLALGLNPDKPGSGNDSGHRTNINIANTNADTINQINTSPQLSIGQASPGGNNISGQSSDIGHLQSILHVLNRSGALEMSMSLLRKEKDLTEEKDLAEERDLTEDNIIDITPTQGNVNEK